MGDGVPGRGFRPMGGQAQAPADGFQSESSAQGPPSQGAGDAGRSRCEERVWAPLRSQGVFPAVGVHIPPQDGLWFGSSQIREETPFLF